MSAFDSFSLASFTSSKPLVDDGGSVVPCTSLDMVEYPSSRLPLSGVSSPSTRSHFADSSAARRHDYVFYYYFIDILNGRCSLQCFHYLTVVRTAYLQVQRLRSVIRDGRLPSVAFQSLQPFSEITARRSFDSHFLHAKRQSERRFNIIKTYYNWRGRESYRFNGKTTQLDELMIFFHF